MHRRHRRHGGLLRRRSAPDGSRTGHGVRHREHRSTRHAIEPGRPGRASVAEPLALARPSFRALRRSGHRRRAVVARKGRPRECGASSGEQPGCSSRPCAEPRHSAGGDPGCSPSNERGSPQPSAKVAPSTPSAATPAASAAEAPAPVAAPAQTAKKAVVAAKPSRPAATVATAARPTATVLVKPKPDRRARRHRRPAPKLRDRARSGCRCSTCRCCSRCCAQPRPCSHA